MAKCRQPPEVGEATVLVIGTSAPRRSGRVELPDLPGFHFAVFGDLDGFLIATLAPEVIVSALTTPDFDVLDMAARLAEIGYRGRYRALVRHLPDPGVVVREVREIAPSLDFDVLVFDP